MMKTVGYVLLGTISLACLSLSQEGAKVRVYEADVSTPEAPGPPLPGGCRPLAGWGPIEQQEQARHIDDPYRAQRNAAAAGGGNVLLVKSYRFMTLKKTECTQSAAQGCPDSAQSWYRVSFASYACDKAGLNALAELKAEGPPEGILVWSGIKTASAAPVSAALAQALPPTPSRSSVPALTGAELEQKVLALLREGVGSDVIVSYVRAHRPSTPLTAEEIVDWKKSGISDEIIRAAFAD